MQKITPFLWFDGRVEEAIEFYTSIFKNTRISNISRDKESSPGEKGKIMSATFELEGQQFMALNGGPHFNFTPAISFFVNCESQEEVDDLWARLSEGGEKSRCGWLKDKFGISWQVIPSALPRLLNTIEPGASKRVMHALMKMNNIIIKDLQDAYENDELTS